jgi:hypothetical protein
MRKADVCLLLFRDLLLLIRNHGSITEDYRTLILPVTPYFRSIIHELTACEVLQELITSTAVAKIAVDSCGLCGDAEDSDGSGT